MPTVLLCSLVFSPDGVSTAQLMKELAVDLVGQGFRVCVVTTTPHYNRDPVAESEQPLRRIALGLAYRSEVGGVEVYHTPTPRKGVGLLSRAIGWLGFHTLGTLIALIKAPRPDVVLVPSPLLTIGVMGWIITKLRGGRMIYNVQELYPDVAIQMGKLRRGVLSSLLFRLERFVYSKATAITAIGEVMSEAIIAKGIDATKIHTIPNFVDVDDLRPMPKENAFSVEHGLAEKFVVSYAGNMGYAQGLKVLLEAAALLQDEPEIAVAFIGDGVLKDDLQAEARARELSNVRFIPHQPYARVPEIYAASDVSVVALLSSVAGEATPSKVYRIMACQRPILAITREGSDLEKTVRRAEAGLVVPGDDARAIAEAIRQLFRDRSMAARFGQSGRQFALQQVSRPIVTGQYARLIERLAGPARRA